MVTRFRAPALVLAGVALFGATAAPASAQEVDDLYAGANAVTASVSVLGTTVGEFAGTSAVAEQTPRVEVGSFGFRALDGAVGIGVSSAVAEGLDSVVRDPGGEGMRCDIPELAALPVADVLSVIDVCSSSEAAIPGIATPSALGAAQAGAVAVNGQALADVVFDLLLDPITTQLDGVVAPIQEALAPVEAGLAAICDELPAELSPTGLAEEANKAGLPITDVIRALPDGEEILEALESDCLLSLQALVDIVASVATIAESVVRDTLLAALDQDLLSVTLGSSASSIFTDKEDLVARAQLQALDVSTLSLQFLIDAIEELVAQHIGGILADVLAALPAELDAVTGLVPALGDVLGPVLDAIQLSGLVDDAPLLQVTVADSLADARSKAGTSDVDTSRSLTGGVTVKISPAIASLLGIPAEVSVSPSESVTIAAGTPLESSISVGSIEPLTETLGASQVQTAGVRVTNTEVRLLTGVQGGIVASTGVTEARLGGTLAASTPAGSLPRTGSTDDLTLFAGLGTLVLLAGTVGLRRRMGQLD